MKKRINPVERNPEKHKVSDLNSLRYFEIVANPAALYSFPYLMIISQK